MQHRILEDTQWKEMSQTVSGHWTIFNEPEKQISDDILSDMIEHLWDLQGTKKEHIPSAVEGFLWV
jgi:hypothetical protein